MEAAAVESSTVETTAMESAAAAHAGLGRRRNSQRDTDRGRKRGRAPNLNCGHRNLP
jgi:hypothetical protein